MRDPSRCIYAYAYVYVHTYMRRICMQTHVYAYVCMLMVMTSVCACSMRSQRTGSSRMKCSWCKLVSRIRVLAVVRIGSVNKSGAVYGSCYFSSCARVHLNLL